MKKLAEHAFNFIDFLLKPSFKMRLTYFLLLISLFNAHGNIYSQHEKINLDLENVTIQEIFDTIENQTKFSFLYSVKYINLNRKVSITAENEKLKHILTRVFKDTNVAYSILDKQIILSLKNRENSPEDEPPLNKSKEQQTLISGRVEDKFGVPLAAVNVVIKGTQRGVATNFEGEFSIKAAVGETMVFSSLGYLGSEIKVKQNENFYVVFMTSSSLELEGVELVSTGYQKIEKERATGSFSNISEKILDTKISQNILDKVQGEVAGVLFDRNLNRQNNPLGITIRGQGSINANTSPLVVVDGFPITSDISSINPNDIESISILKDAAAASIWGIRATNGVIVIATKNGARNSKINVEFSVSTAFTPKPDLSRNGLASPATQVAYKRELFEKGGYFRSDQLFAGDLNRASLEQLDPVIEVLLLQQRGGISQTDADVRLEQLANTDLRKEYSDLILRPTIWNQYNLGISGGGEKYDFRVALSYNNNEERLIGTGSDQIILNLDNTADLSKKIKVRTSINFSQSTTNAAPSNGPILGLPSFGNVNPQNVFRSLPISSRILDDNGNLLPMSGFGGVNPLSSELALRQGFAYPWTFNLKQEFDNANNVTKRTEIRMQSAIDYTIFKDLVATLSYQFEWGVINERNNYNENVFAVRNAVNLFTQLDENGTASNNPIPLGGILDVANIFETSHTLRGQLNYDRNFNKGLHRVTAIAGYEARQTTRELNSDRKYGYDEQALNNRQPDFVSQFQLPLDPFNSPLLIESNSFENFTENRFISYYANGAYTFDDTYTLSGSIRLDDTNLFGLSDEARNIPLYSLGARWNIKNDFFETNDYINSLQLRATYGINGNVAIRETSAFLQTTSRLEALSPFNQFSSFISSVPNPLLRLEKTRTLNLGLDFGLFDNSVTGSIEYYQKESEDLLITRRLNSTSGLTNALLNSGNLTNNGVDLNLGIRLIETDNFDFRTTGNFSVNTNTLTNVDTSSDFFDFINGNAIVQGNALGTEYSFNYAGLDRNGAPQFIDANGTIVDFRADIEDVEALLNEGTVIPRYYGSWINDISYKNISLRTLATFKAGHVFQFVENAYVPSFIPQANVGEEFNNRWQQPGDESFTDVPALPSLTDAFAPGYSNLVQANKFFDSASHIRLSQVALSYRLPQKVLEKLSLIGFNIGLQADNLAVWNFNKWGVDPENTVIPLQPTITLRTNIIF